MRISYAVFITIQSIIRRDAKPINPKCLLCQLSVFFLLFVIFAVLSSKKSTLKQEKGTRQKGDTRQNILTASFKQEKTRSEEKTRTQRRSVQLSRRYWMRDCIDKVQSRCNSLFCFVWFLLMRGVEGLFIMSVSWELWGRGFMRWRY